MKTKLFLLAVTGWALAAMAALENNGGFAISDVTLKSRQPWQNYVDVDFTLTAPAGREDELVEMDVAASNGLDRVTVADTSLHAPLVKHGRNRFIWNAGTSYSGLTLGKVRFYLAVAQTNVQERPYFTVNLNSGVRNWYPASFSNRVTAAFYKTEYMPFGYIPSTVSQVWKELAGTNTFVIGSPTNEIWKTESDNYREEQREVKLTHGFWLGVFPVTVAQWEALGKTASVPAAGTANRDWYATCYATYEIVRGRDTLTSGYCFGKDVDGQGRPAVDPSKYIGLFRAKTGLDVDLPTEYQWEYACRAGVTNAYWWAPAVINGDTMKGNPGASVTQIVGTKRANRWGLHDMVGCAHNWTTTLGRKANNTDDSSLILYADDPAADANGILVDPVGCPPPSGYGDNTPFYRVTRGSHPFTSNIITDRFGNEGPISLRVYRSAYRYAQVTNKGEDNLESFRLCLTNPEADTEWFPPGE